MSTRFDLQKTRFSPACIAKHGAPGAWTFVGVVEVRADEMGIEIIEAWTNAHGAPFDLQSFFVVGPLAAAALDCEPRMTIAESVDVPRECVRCGTCCTAARERYIPITAARYEQMSEATRALVTLLDPDEEIPANAVPPGSAPPIAYMKMAANDLCAALVVDPAEGTFKCSVYGERPDLCRDFAQGGEGCKFHLFSKRRLPMFALAEAKRVSATTG